MTKLKPYSKYKDSGVEWIGKIPEDWEVSKLKRVSETKQINVNVQQIKKQDWYYYEIPTIQETGEGKVESGKNISSNKYLLSGGEILVSKLNPRKGTIVQVKKHELPIICSTELIPIVPDKINSRFIYYALNNKVTADVFNSMVTSVTNSHQRINPNDIENYFITFPRLDIQSKIIATLDSKTVQIDSLIADKKRLIKLLEEKRQAIITETVTRGLDPDVKMKDSGIEWIGEIPAHWKTAKIKYYSELKTGATPSRGNLNYWNDGKINWMTSGEVNQEYVYKVKNKITQLGFENSSTVILPINTVMVALNGQGKTKGKVAILKVESTCNQSLVGFVCDERNLHYNYLYYFLKSKYEDLRGLVGDGLRDGISLGLLKTLHISMPKYSDQIKTSDQLDQKNKNINEVIEKINSQISKLQEYREALIYEAVTGKIDLRDYKVKSNEN